MDQLASDLQQGVIAAPAAAAHVRRTNPVELGTIQYVNLNGKHGDMQAALSAAKASGKPIFANFAEFPGWRGCREAGAIFTDPAVVRAAEELFVPCVFNTYDRHSPKLNEPMRAWALNLKGSWWGYLRLVSADGRQVLAGTRQITGAGQLAEVKDAMREALEELGIQVPSYLA